ncbi:group II intron reverse transcriptase/maturase [Algivirga pacifica]|uniref:RNA-directed DNA polymerase n=1 Tax=Algivirga pacifica TaxID=1162670 RepID=A0ABP9DNE3_9BACT
MRGEQQKISEDSSLRNDRSATESYSGVPTLVRITENNFTGKTEEKGTLLEKILDPMNLNLAYKRVKKNKGKGGIDKMEVESLYDYFVEHKEYLLRSILNGKYRPNPVRRVYIPKENGQQRSLGIPTVVDRVIQQAIHQVISPLYEEDFHENSYGFRPNRNAHQALKHCMSKAEQGYKYVVDIDLEKFFDTVNHSKLIEVLSRKVKDGRVLSLIHKYLNAGVVESGLFQRTAEGVPQGGPLSPLLSNILLNELDQELSHRGHEFARYADDLIIMCRSKRSADRVLKSITNFIEKTLYLRVNKEKTQVGHIKEVKFLGYGFYMNQEKCRARVHPKSVREMKNRLRALTSRSNGWSNELRKLKLKLFIQGWVNYFKLADMKKLLKGIDEWLRRRIRMVIWKQWKRVRTRIRNLTKLGIGKDKAYQFGNTRKGYWRIANSPILSQTITNKRLKSSGYTFLLDYYLSVKA